MTPRNEEHLEKLARAALRDLPLRRAPETLHARVLVALSRRAALPWWRQGFAHWPAPARFAFLALSFSLMGTGAWAMGGLSAVDFNPILMPGLGWAQGFAAVGAALGNAAGIVIHSINPRWFYGILALVAVANAVLIGVGATAYRVLQSNRDNPL